MTSIKNKIHYILNEVKTDSNLKRFMIPSAEMREFIGDEYGDGFEYEYTYTNVEHTVTNKIFTDLWVQDMIKLNELLSDLDYNAMALGLEKAVPGFRIQRFESFAEESGTTKKQIFKNLKFIDLKIRKLIKQVIKIPYTIKTRTFVENGWNNEHVLYEMYIKYLF